MTPAQRRRIEDLYQRLQGLARDQREAVLQQLCPDDAEVRAEVSRLAGTRLEAAATPDVQADVRGMLGPLDHAVGTFIGPYKLLSVLGEGGFGIVYLAERREPMVQRVALKVIKPGMDSRAVLARFEAERQALALMDHPNIARVYDAGATAEGRPYFVMEHVPGIPITEHCDKERLTIRQRLELFATVCDAVAHAHMKGIIHRDIKPSNILVSVRETGEGVPKVIDFGVAKATQMRLTEQTVFTEQGVLIGTPEYMSPEQAEMNAQDIDTRSDVYSLGVVLYELLTGTVPFDPRVLRAKGMEEIRRIIREDDPARPSTRLTHLSAIEGEAVGARRNADRSVLARELRRELEWMPLKAMRKDRSERYRTAVDLADDVRAYLAGRPLSAAPEGAMYRARKFVRRHRGPVGAAGLVALALGVGAGVSIWQAVRAFRAEGRSEASATTAREEAAIADAVNAFFNDDLLAAVGPAAPGDPGRGKDVMMRDVLDRAAASLERAVATGGRFAGKPRVEAALRRTLAVTYSRLGENEKAAVYGARAYTLSLELFGPESPQTLGAMVVHGRTMLGTGRVAEAERILTKAVSAADQALGPVHPTTIDAATNLAGVYMQQDRHDEAEPLLLRATRALDADGGEVRHAPLLAANNLALVYKNTGRDKQAEGLFRACIEAYKRLGREDEPEALRPVNNLAVLLRRSGRFDEAEPLFRQVIQARVRILGDEHQDTLGARVNLGNLLLDMGRTEEAEQLLTETLPTLRRVVGPHGDFTRNCLASLANVAIKKGDLARAASVLSELVEAEERALGPDHPRTVWAREQLDRVRRD